MNARATGAQGAQEFLRFSVRILTAIFICALSVSGGVAQGNSCVINSGQNEIQPHTGSAAPVQLEGELEVVYQDLKGGQARLLHTLKLSDGTRVPLHFVDELPAGLQSGQHVCVSGQQSGGSLILYSGSTTTTTTTTSTATSSTAPLPNTFGAQSTLVLLLSFQDAPSNQPWTPAQVQTDIFTSSGLNGFIQEASYGQTSLSGAVYGWYVIPVSSTTCDTNQIATAANSAASAAGVVLAGYSHLVYVFPSTSACAWAGAATIGGSPSQSWINGGNTATNRLDQGILAHEMGHNLGLYHSHGLDCGSVVVGGECTVREYGDTFDVMGAGEGHYNAAQKDRLGWLNYGSSPGIISVAVSGTYVYTLLPYEPVGSGTKALKVLKFTNPTTGISYNYYVEYRQPVGLDSFITSLPSQNITNGVVIHLVQDSDPNSNELLDITPQSSSLYDWNDVALTVGATYSDPDAGVTITLQSVSSNGATVSVGISQPSCVHAVPSISISPSQPSAVPAGTTLSYTVTVTDNDSSSCGASTFNFQPAIAYGWNDTLSNSQLTLSPGATSSVTLAVTSASNSNVGTNPVNVKATSTADFVYSATVSATYSVGASAPPPPTGSSLTVSLSVSGASFTPPGAVPISATVTNGGSPASGAQVTFTLTTPNGSITTQNATTGTNGTAVWNYKLSGKSLSGTYSVVAQASLGSGSSGGKKIPGAASTLAAVSSNTATFSVQ
jgi:hypothetical protein